MVWWRQFRASLRDTRVLLREFRTPLLLFLAVVLAATFSFRALWLLAYGEQLPVLEALYDIITMIFFAAQIPFPEEWYLAVYFFVMPVIGLAFLARGIADFVTLLFNRSLRQSQWEEAVAATYSDHIIICGFGRLGIRVMRELVSLNEDNVVLIENKADSAKLDEAKANNIPVIIGDARSGETLTKAGIKKARSIIVCTNDDLMNIQIATRIRELNQSVRLVMRMFDDDFARSIAGHFDISAVFSASQMAAPAFAGAAVGVDIIQTFSVDNRILAMSRMVVQKDTRLDGTTIEELETGGDLSVVLLQSGGSVDVHPEHDARLKAGDVIAFVADLPTIRIIASKWNKQR
jgi:Trk K+ transport system NAD-binding subunit